jgi:general transcription factor IIIA
MDESSVPATPASTIFSLPAYVFPTYNELQAHIAKTHPPTCSHCHVACKTKRELSSHIELHHPDAINPFVSHSSAQNFACNFPDCGRTFTKKGNLKVHIRSVHENIKQFICGETDLSQSNKLVYDDGEAVNWDHSGCGRAFTAKAMLENHVRTAHLGLDRWEKANGRKKGIESQGNTPKSSGGNRKAKAFTATSLLTGHGYQESGRDIPCLIASCDNMFYRDFDMRRHCASVHGMAEVEIEERFLEREAQQGGAFWYGGIDPEEERGFAEYEEDDEMYNAKYFGRGGFGEGMVDPQLENMEMVAQYVRGVEEAE